VAGGIVTDPLVAPGERVTARYLGPTETRGSRIQVRWRGRRRAVPFNYGVSDTFTWAASQVIGVPEGRLRRQYDDRFDDVDRRVYLVEPMEEHGERS